MEDSIVDTPLISVIIPIYNVEQYLLKCLDSIIGQTYKNIEIICVNDGSLDNCQQILEEYKLKDSRLIIINQQNQGVSTARNQGLNKANGDYIYFVDPDDWIDTTLIEKAVNCICENKSDIVIFDAINVYKNSQIPVRRVNNFVKKNNLYSFYFNEAKNIIYHTPTSWSKLYRKSFLNVHKLYFPKDITLGEDVVFWLSLLSYNPKISILDEPLYYYLKRDDSATGLINEKALDEQWNLYEYIINSADYKLYLEEYKILILDFCCRLAVYRYSCADSLRLLFIYEKTISKFLKEYKNFKIIGLFKLQGYKLLKLRLFYTIGKKIVLCYLKKINFKRRNR